MDISVSSACEKFGLTLVGGGENSSNTITNVYIGDLLSWVMGKAKEGCAWITIQSHINIVAVALLVNAACIIICEDSVPDADTIAKSEAEGIPLLQTSLTSYEIAELFAELNKR